MQSSASALRREYSSARNSWAACSSTSEGLDHLRRQEAGSQAACRTPARGPWPPPGAHELPQRIKPEPGKARREVGDRLGPGCGEIEGGPGPRESARRPLRGSGRVTWTTSIVAAARSGSPWLGRAPPVGLEWIASALPWLARPPPPGGMTGDPRTVAAGLRAPDLPRVIAKKEHSAARSPADGEPILVAIGEFNCRARDRRLEQGVGIARVGLLDSPALGRQHGPDRHRGTDRVDPPPRFLRRGFAVRARVKELTDGLAQGPHLWQASGRGLDAGNPAPLGGDPRLKLTLILEQVEVADRGDHHRVREVDRGREAEPGKGLVGHPTPFVVNRVSTW